jgi:hypothetical protein
MKATRKLLATALTACAALIATDVMAQSSGRQGAGAHRGGDRNHGSRDGGHRHGGHRWHGNRGGHWHGHRGWYPSFGFYYGLPLFWGAAWGWPYYYDHWNYPGERVIYREREVFPEGAIAPMPGPSTEVPRAEGAPTRGPLYMNYCESAKAYFPKVTTCPEGWRLATPSS